MSLFTSDPWLVLKCPLLAGFECPLTVNPVNPVHSRPDVVAPEAILTGFTEFTGFGLVCNDSLPTMEVKDGSQPHLALDLDLGVTAGSRSLDRRVGLPA